MPGKEGVAGDGRRAWPCLPLPLNGRLPTPQNKGKAAAASNLNKLTTPLDKQLVPVPIEPGPQIVS